MNNLINVVNNLLQCCAAPCQQCCTAPYQQLLSTTIVHSCPRSTTIVESLLTTINKLFSSTIYFHRQINGYKCLCAPGMTGVNCDESIPQCSSKPCKNNAECVEVPGSYECKCKNGWTGRFCEVNRDDCSSQTCMNGGICRDKVDGFTCECVAGYKGERCEINIDDCSTDPCGQNGM